MIIVTKDPVQNANVSYTFGSTDVLRPGSVYQWYHCGTYLPSQWVCNQLNTPPLAEGSCPEQCSVNLDATESRSAEWAPLGTLVDHCLAQPSTPNRKLQVNIPLCITVVVLTSSRRWSC